MQPFDVIFRPIWRHFFEILYSVSFRIFTRIRKPLINRQMNKLRTPLSHSRGDHESFNRPIIQATNKSSDKFLVDLPINESINQLVSFFFKAKENYFCSIYFTSWIRCWICPETIKDWEGLPFVDMTKTFIILIKKPSNYIRGSSLVIPIG